MDRRVNIDTGRLSDSFNETMLQHNNMINELNCEIESETLNDRRKLQDIRKSLDRLRNKLDIQIQLQGISIMLSNNTNSTSNIIKFNIFFVITGIFSCLTSNAFAILNIYTSIHFYYTKNQYNWFMPYFVYSMCYNLYNLYNNIEYGKIVYYAKKNNLTISDDSKINKNDIPWSKNTMYKIFKIICYLATFVSFILSIYLIDLSFNIQSCLETEYDFCNIIKFIGFYNLSVLIIIFIIIVAYLIKNKCCKNHDIAPEPEPVDVELTLRMRALNMLHNSISTAIENIDRKMIKSNCHY